MELIAFLVIVALLAQLFGKSSPEKCPGCDGHGKTYYQNYNEELQRYYDSSDQCGVCSGAGKVRFVKKEKGVKYYEPVWSKNN